MNEIMEERSNYYGYRNDSCGKKGFIYDKKGHHIYEANCKQFSCAYCRPIEIHKILKKVVKTARKYNLTRHLVITMPGDDYRNKYDADASFYDFSDKWNELKTVIQQRYFSEKTYVVWEDEDGYHKRMQFIPWGDFNYIGFRRSQKDGYCHLHALVGSYIPKDVIDNLCERVGLGSTWIESIKIRRITHYLSKYWYKDHEWFIPKGMKHLTKSHSINWIDHNKKSDVKRWFMIMNDKGSYRNHLEMMDTEVMALSGGYPLPFDYLLKEHRKIIRRKAT